MPRPVRGPFSCRHEARQRRLRTVRPAAPLRAGPRRLDARWKALQARGASRTASPPQGAAAQRVAMQWAVRVNEAYQRLKDPLKRAAYLCELQRRADRGREQHGDAGRLPDAADGMARGARRGATTPRRVEALARTRSTPTAHARLQRSSALLDDERRLRRPRRGRCRALMFVERFADDVDARARGAGTIAPMALLQISEPGAVARPAPAAHRRRHRPRHHPLAGRRGAQRRGRMPARRAGPRDPAVGRALPRRRPAASRLRARWPRRPTTRDNTIVSVKRLMGRGAGRHRRPRAAALPLRRRRRAWSQLHTARRREVAGRGLGRDPRHAAPARRGHLRRRALRRRDHRAGVLRRRPAPGHQGRGAARRPERAAPDQRADRGRHRLRPGQRQRGPLRGLRPRRRHLRHLDPAADAGRVRGDRHRRRLGARRRRLSTARWPTGCCAQAGLRGRERRTTRRAAADGRARRQGGADRREPRPCCAAVLGGTARSRCRSRATSSRPSRAASTARTIAAVRKALRDAKRRARTRCRASCWSAARRACRRSAARSASSSAASR